MVVANPSHALDTSVFRKSGHRFCDQNTLK